MGIDDQEGKARGEGDGDGEADTIGCGEAKRGDMLRRCGWRKGGGITPDEEGETVMFAVGALAEEEMKVRGEGGLEAGEEFGVEPDFLKGNNVGGGGE